MVTGAYIKVMQACHIGDSGMRKINEWKFSFFLFFGIIMHSLQLPCIHSVETS